MPLNSYFEAYEKPSIHTFEKKENPQNYDILVSQFQHVKPKRHTLGLVGGNEVYNIKGNRVDLESDLFGITRPFTWSTERKHLPTNNSDVIDRKNPKNNIHVEATPIVREEFQLWSYSEVNAPLSFNKEACSMPHKF
jgi:hypothetical protein